MPLPHEKLIAWKRADDLFIDIHRLTARAFPTSERFLLTSQIRRAAYSVPANIVEGCARRYLKAEANHFNTSEASLAEVGYCLHVARRLEYVDEATYHQFDMQVRQTAAPLVGLIRSLT
jgi:four helix bundle protein